MIITTIIATCSAGGRSPAQPLLECKGRVAPAAVPELRREETVLSDSCLFLWNRSTSVASQKLRFVFNLQRLYMKKTVRTKSCVKHLPPTLKPCKFFTKHPAHQF